MDLTITLETEHWSRRFNGYGSIAGTVTEAPDGDPLARRVHIFDRETGHHVRTVWSDAAGDFSVHGLDHTRLYLAVALDYTATYNAVVADRVTAEVSL